MANEFRQILQHHLNQTRAGLYGQFEHAFNFNTGPDQDALLKQYTISPEFQKKANPDGFC